MKKIYIFKHYPPPSPSPSPIPLALERLPCTLITTSSLKKLLDPPLNICSTCRNRFDQ